MSATPQEIFERYIWTGALTQNAAALAELFTADGVYEAPLIPAGHAFPRRMEGREEIRKAMAAHYERPVRAERTPNTEKSRYVLHTTADPDVFIAEIDATLDGSAGTTTLSQVQIFRLSDGKIALLRDYFAPEEMD